MHPDRQALQRTGGYRDHDRNFGHDRDHYRDRDCDSHRHRTRNSDRDYHRDRRDRDRDYERERDRDGRRDNYRERTDGRSGTDRERSPRGDSGDKGKARFMTQDEQSDQYVAGEDQFVLMQAKKKAATRLREGRATDGDLLVFPLRYVEPRREDFDDEEGDLYLGTPGVAKVLGGCRTVAVVEKVKEEIEAYQALESWPESRRYWEALKVIVWEQLAELKGTVRKTVSQDVAENIENILSGKSVEQLENMEGKIKEKLDSGDPNVDSEYWEELLDRLAVWKAKGVVSMTEENIRKKRAELIRPKDPEFADKVEAGTDYTGPPKPRRPSASEQPSRNRNKELERILKEHTSRWEEPINTSRFAADGPIDFTSASKALYEREMARGIRDDEEVFTAEEEVAPDARALAKAAEGGYQLKKAKYFNRVQMGYEWNKYNQTHYDSENLPPRVVQGYKFNIFYPELFDKTKAPTYRIIRDKKTMANGAEGEAPTCLLKFSAGPPYQDLVFRILDQEWDYSSKRERGFKSSFDHGVLQLYFQFKKVYYRK